METVINTQRACAISAAENKIESTKWIAAEIYSGKMTHRRNTPIAADNTGRWAEG